MTQMILSQNTPSITIADISISQDDEGRYCLNDLHRAAGGESRHQPGKWLENQQTKELISEYEITGIPVILKKQGFGTFVAKDLVYDYAMWISAAFKVKVIRAYDEMATAKPMTHLETARMLVASLEEVEKLQQENATLLPKAELLAELYVDNETTFLIGTIAGMASPPIKADDLRSILKADGWIKWVEGENTWLPSAHALAKGWMIVRLDRANGKDYACATFTKQGIEQLRHTQALCDLFKHVPIGQEIFRNGKIKVLQHEHKVVH